MDIGINSVLSALELRDVTLARAEDEVSREMALRVPISYRALSHLQMAAERGGEGEQLADSVATVAPRTAADPPAFPVSDQAQLRVVGNSPHRSY
jgi:hypothetical protein